MALTEYLQRCVHCTLECYKQDETSSSDGASPVKSQGVKYGMKYICYGGHQGHTANLQGSSEAMVTTGGGGAGSEREHERTFVTVRSTCAPRRRVYRQQGRCTSQRSRLAGSSVLRNRQKHAIDISLFPSSNIMSGCTCCGAPYGRSTVHTSRYCAWRKCIAPALKS